MSKDEPREREIAAYVTGELTPRHRRRFEAHLLECETCWREVRVSGDGRRAAESLRELAPARLRDDVRGAVALSPTPSRSSVPAAAVVTAGLTVLLVSGVVMVGISRSSSQPQPIAAALSVFESRATPGSASTAAPIFRGFGLQLRSTGRVSLGTVRADAYLYQSGSGSVELFVSERDFPEAIGARDTMTGGWTARAGATFLSCGSNPAPYLLMGADEGLVRRIDGAIALGSVGFDR